MKESDDKKYIVASDEPFRLNTMNDLYELRSMIFRVNVINVGGVECTDYKRICQVARNFEGELFDWYMLFHEEYESSLEGLKFELFLEELKKFISSKPVIHRVYERYYTIKQKANVVDYNAEFHKIVFFLSRVNFSEIALISRYVHGLKREIKNMIIACRSQPVSLTEVMGLALEKEKDVQNKMYQNFITRTHAIRKPQRCKDNSIAFLDNAHSQSNNHNDSKPHNNGNKKRRRRSSESLSNASKTQVSNINGHTVTKRKSSSKYDTHATLSNTNPSWKKSESYTLDNNNKNGSSLYRTRSSSSIPIEDMPLSNLTNIKPKNEESVSLSAPPLQSSLAQNLCNTRSHRNPRDVRKTNLSKLTKSERIELKKLGICIRCRIGKHDSKTCHGI